MSTLKDLIDLKYDRKLALRTLAEHQAGRLLLVHNGGMWNITAELMCLLSLYQDREVVTLLDANDIPREVNPKELLEQAKVRHQEVLNDWLIEYNKAASIRTAKHLLKDNNGN